MKSISKYILVLLYVGAAVISLLILVKPGAAVFYIKKNVDRQLVVQDAGFANYYKLAVDARIIRTQGILLYEDGHHLALAREEFVANDGGRAYSISAPYKGSVYLYPSASVNSSPITKDRTYTLYLPLKLISSRMAIIYLLFLSPLLVLFLVFVLTYLKHRPAKIGSPSGILLVLDRFIDQALKSIRSYLHWLGQQIKKRAPFWKRLFTVTVFVAYFYIFMEWLFFVTMPSFMSLMSFLNKLEIFLISGLIFSLFCLSILVIFFIIDLLGLIAHISGVTRYAGVAIPALTLAALALLLVDNFTYTIFKFGISTSSGFVRGVYALFFVLLVGYMYYRMLIIFNFAGSRSLKIQTVNRWFYACLGMLVITTGLALANLNFRSILSDNINTETQRETRLPNILLLGSDGLNADNLSVYGYYRDTTPNLKELAKSSLVAENAFTNAGNSAGSVISLMTSKLPTQTRVLYPPDILTGINSFQHMPGILKNLGYTTVEYGVPYYIDAYNYNLQGGFDVVNNRTLNVGKLSDLGRELGFDNEVYLLSRLIWRISDRILHVFFIREMQNPFDIVTQTIPNISDETKISQALSLFDQAKTPLFIHIHLLGTHGGFYGPKVRVFSKGESQPQPWMTDFYDDTLLTFDSYVGKIVDQLKEDGQFDNTILIIYTDHNKEFKVDARVPLIIHFPGGSQTGEIIRSVENMDIAPTVLDYLGLPIPAWMEGESMLKSEADDSRLIFATGTQKIKPNEQNVSFLDPAQNKPPFYQFSYVTVFDCQKWYSIDLTTIQWSSGDVSGYVNPCSSEKLLSMDQIKQAVYLRLASDGFDISSLP